jgi:membrane protease YdiL (CAAX protease family)
MNALIKSKVCQAILRALTITKRIALIIKSVVAAGIFVCLCWALAHFTNKAIPLWHIKNAAGSIAYEALAGLMAAVCIALILNFLDELRESAEKICQSVKNKLKHCAGKH